MLPGNEVVTLPESPISTRVTNIGHKCHAMYRSLLGATDHGYDNSEDLHCRCSGSTASTAVVPRTTAQLERLAAHRTRQIDHYLHTASRRIIDLLVAEGIGTLIIGKNPLWKQEVGMGKRNSQNFVSVPHARFIHMLNYKAALVGICVILTEESYTSVASFLDRDPLPVYGAEEEAKPAFSGKRVTRGLYGAGDERHLNADVNGAYNIIRKVLPDAFHGKGIAGAAVHPVRLAVRTKRTVQSAACLDTVY